jgi:hypothetical protein
MTDHYPPLIAELLAIPHPTALGVGSPNETAGARLRGLDPVAVFAPIPVHELDMAKSCLAGLWLRFDFLDESHKISQEVETPTGSFWHAIMHRREGDFGNSKYWWRRVGQHPALIGDPSAFVDAVEACVVRGEGAVTALQAQQRREWETLFDYCYRCAVATRET